jgi:hypothetical protein
MKPIRTIFIAVYIFSCNFTVAKNPDSTLSKILTKKNIIEKICKEFNIDMKTLSAIIFVERRENYTWEDDAMDEYLAQVGLNSSIGFCQVKMKTAYWIENQLIDTNSIYFPGQAYFGKLQISKKPQEIIDRLKNDSLNIMYAAAYLRIMNSRWEKESYPINNRPEILGTLYSTGLFYKNGDERKPNNNPKANKFGVMVKESMGLFRNINFK